MKLRKFTNDGMARFDALRSSSNIAFHQISMLIEDASQSEIAAIDVEVEHQSLPTRYAVGEYLSDLFSGAEGPQRDVDAGTWTWLSAFHFKQLCPSGIRPGERARWVPGIGDFRRYYRHLLAGPYYIYRAHQDNPIRAMAVLATAPYAPGELVAQLASRQELVTNASVMEVATRLYINPTTNTPKRGAAGKVPGSARRFADILNQLDLTWDLYGLNANKLLDLLPPEFDQFKP